MGRSTSDGVTGGALAGGGGDAAAAPAAFESDWAAEAGELWLPLRVAGSTAFETAGVAGLEPCASRGGVAETMRDGSLSMGAGSVRRECWEEDLDLGGHGSEAD